MASMSLQATYDQARHWLESNDLNRAISLAQYILEQYPDNLDAYRILGEAHLANRQLDRAQEAFERVLRSDPENIPAHVGLGITYERQGKLDRAMTEFEQALEIKPDMPELRSQLLRLYTEAWGSEHAHLRLSRAGLARLYAKGHMLPQAIGEFRQVIAEQPDRFDAMVAMAEALWRDGQEDAAISLCRDILAKRPEALKANLILGYLEMASGLPEGERAWESARQMDPYQVVARAVFDTLPPDTSDEPVIEEWDEDAWRQRRAEEQQERIAATRPMEAVTPLGTSADSISNGSHRDLPTPRPTPATQAAGSDDFLAGLLAITPPPPPPISEPEEDLDLDLGMAPFSLDDLDSERGASKPPAPSAALPDAEEPTMTPFSLADLGLSDEEVASLDTLTEPPATQLPAPPDAEEPTTTPLSLADLGLSDEEIASLESASAPAPADTRPPAPPPPAEDEDTLGMTPFSLADLGLSDEEIAGLDSLGMGSGATPERPARDRAAPPDSTAQPTRSGSSTSDEEGLDAGGLPADLQPFSLDELDLSGTGAGAPNIGGLDASLQPFSFDEPPPQRPRVSGFAADESFETAPDEQESIPETGGYSWQQPTQKSGTSFLKSARSEPQPEEGSIFSKLKQRHQEEVKSQPAEPLPPVSLGAEEDHLGLFSLDEVSLRDDEGQQALAAAAMPAPAAPTPSPTPVEPPPPSLSRDQSARPVEVDNLQEAIEAGQVQPFSLADLGLSEEEIAALGLGDVAASAPAPATPEAAQPPAPEVAPPESDSGRSGVSALDDLEPAPPDRAASEPAAETRAGENDEALPVIGELQPFSLTDLGLSEEEIDALGLGSASEPEEAVGSELGITEEELEGLNLGDLNWHQPPATPPTPPQPEPPGEIGLQATSGDLMLDRLLALGREQGYVDISDIIAAVENPEAEAERIEDIGRRLHEAQIEIRDGDEVIDMDSEYAEEEELPAYSEHETVEPAPTASEEPSLAPFSLADLGLSDEEIASLGLADETVAAPEPAPRQEEEPAMTPFSLSDLGLSDEEIAALGIGEAALAAPTPEPETVPAAAAPEPEPAPRQDEEPVMTPFSLADLGLSDEEIAALGIGATPAAAPEPPAAESEPEPAPRQEEEPAAPVMHEPATAAPEAAQAPVEELPAMVPQPVRAVTDTASPRPVAPAAPPPHVSRASAADQPPASSGSDLLDAYLRRLDADPQNYMLRLSIARVGGQLGMTDVVVQQYRYLIKQNALIDQIVDDLNDLISDADDRQLLKRLHRTLGDAYTKQGRLAEAIDEYSWTPAGS